MTIVTDTAVKVLVTRETTATLRPRYEGSNISTWIGFKHINYLVEEAVLEHFRASGLPARGLYEAHGLGLDIVSLDTRILSALHMDDLAVAHVVPNTKDGDRTLGFKVSIDVDRGSTTTKAVTSKVRVSLRVDSYLEDAGEIPPELSRFTVERLGADLAEPPTVPAATVATANNTSLAAGRGTTGSDPVLDQLLAGKNAFGWKWRIPYPYCHFTERLQMSGYLRQMEEVVDLFLADRGISIKTLLDDRRWIPAVPHSKIRILDEALIEDDLYTIYTVEQVFKDLTYTSRMDCYVVRDGKLRPTATGTITHGYAVIDNRRDWRLVNFDQQVLDAFHGKGPA